MLTIHHHHLSTTMGNCPTPFILKLNISLVYLVYIIYLAYIRLTYYGTSIIYYIMCARVSYSDDPVSCKLWGWISASREEDTRVCNIQNRKTSNILLLLLLLYTRKVNVAYNNRIACAVKTTLVPFGVITHTLARVCVGLYAYYYYYYYTFLLLHG